MKICLNWNHTIDNFQYDKFLILLLINLINVSMKIINEDEKEGIVEVVPETLNDLWHLSHVIQIGKC